MKNMTLREITESECDALLNTYSQFDKKAKEFIGNNSKEPFYSTFMINNPDFITDVYRNTGMILGIDRKEITDRYSLLFETIKEIKSL